MKCGICGKEMKEVQVPSISVEDVKEEGKVFPVVLKCHLIRIYGCEDCPVRATYSETKDYLAVPDPIIDGKTCVHSGACKKEHKFTIDGINPICPCRDYLAKELTNCNDKGCQGCTECEEHK